MFFSNTSFDCVFPRDVERQSKPVTRAEGPLAGRGSLLSCEVVGSVNAYPLSQVILIYESVSPEKFSASTWSESEQVSVVHSLAWSSDSPADTFPVLSMETGQNLVTLRVHQPWRQKARDRGSESTLLRSTPDDGLV